MGNAGFISATVGFLLGLMQGFCNGLGLRECRGVLAEFIQRTENPLMKTSTLNHKIKAPIILGFLVRGTGFSG